jgi:hypothetical protein
MALDIQVKEIRRVAGSIIHVEHYNGVWRAKNGKYPAYAGGTTFLVEFIGTQLPKRISMGRFKELGYGAVRLLPNMEKLRISKEVPITKSDDVQKPIVPTLVSLIREHAKRRLKLRELENFAISNAKKGNVKLNNHQCGRLEQLMTDSKNITQVHHWLDENKQKSIGEALIKAHLLYDFDKKPHAYIRSDIYRDLDWEYTRHFWRTFFAVLRKMNKN